MNDVAQGGAPQPSTAGVAPAGESAQPQASGAAQADFSKIDLTALPQYRELQSKNDREKAALQAQARQMQAQIDELKRSQASQKLANIAALDPEERAAALQQQLESMQAEQARQTEQARLMQSATQIIARAGIQPNDPRLSDIAAMAQAGFTPELLTVLSTRVVDLVTQDRDAAALAAQKATEDARAKVTADQTAREQAARVQALNDAGVTATSNAQPQVIAPQSDKDKKVANLKARFAALRGRGTDSPDYRRFVNDMRGAGVTWGDLGYH